MTHKLTLKSIAPVTHNTYHLTMDRPEGFSFEPGQATEIAIDKDGWRDEARPFTMVSQPEDDELAFVIKSYPDHDGMTEQVATLSKGDGLLVETPFGAITDHGPGVFIAGGAGITPFISILRKRDRDGTLDGAHLIFSNATEKDIILKDEFDRMNGLKKTYIVTNDPDSPHSGDQLDASTLDELIGSKDQAFYICGPGPMVDDVRDALKEIGVSEDNIVTEDGW
ncbi:FAD-binding oxidoreductase [Litoreibacter arenae]|uniref:Ferredoxin reductase n=1 Tax=Litoreibacter arenae DSM 19593 TaxID=1123360 RepID=S9QIQ0_9RHOB|nr:FAD-binding oxidoreductase [Litoreibacter arenae]EPX79458.1 Ferredoxin reductase [Litoreibacter arenae DSM 19593]